MLRPYPMKLVHKHVVTRDKRDLKRETEQMMDDMEFLGSRKHIHGIPNRQVFFWTESVVPMYATYAITKKRDGRYVQVDSIPETEDYIDAYEALRNSLIMKTMHEEE